MNLAQLRLETRYTLDDLDAEYWSDTEINTWINEAAVTMGTRAQPLNSAVQMSAVVGQQEYVLPRDVDEIITVKFYQGTLFRIQFEDQRKLQEGGLVQATPTNYYTRWGTLMFTNQVAGGDITITDIPQGGSTKAEFVLGLWPIPNSTNHITVFYKARHYALVMDEDEPAVPEEFQRGLIYYAVAIGKMREQATDEYKEFMGMYAEYAKGCKEKFDNAGQEDVFPQLNVRNVNRSRPFDGSSWVYLGHANY